MADNEIKELSKYQHARLRTEMYLGSRAMHTQMVLVYDKDGIPSLEEISWVPAIYTAFREILDNSLDEIVGHGYGNRVDISFDETTGVVSISDNGRGIPLDKIELALSSTMAGRNFEERKEVAGTNGIGASVVNYCSEWFKVEVIRDGKKYTQLFTEGDAVFDELVRNKPSIKESKGKTGTTISFKLSGEVFNNTTLPEKFVWSRMFELAAVNYLMSFYYNGNKIKVKPSIEKTIFDSKPIIVEMAESDFKTKFMITPNFHTEGNDFYHSIVNNIPAFNGGPHVDAFRRGFIAGILRNLEKESKRRKLKPNRSDVNDGLLVFNVTQMSAPNFDSQSKTRLINETAGKHVAKMLAEEKVFVDIIRKNKGWIDEIFVRCSERTNKQDAKDLANASKKLKRKKVAKLTDATSKKRSECILFLAEGDSAISGMSSVRNPKIHGGLPLRGKVMNVNGEPPKKVLDSMALVDIISAVGLVLGEPAVRENLRYGKLYVATDMDPDGLNIGALIVNFFFTYWPELFDEEEPFIYMFMTPFVIAEKGNKRKYWYAHDYHKFDPSKMSGWSITRAKGLGTLQEADWQHSLDFPELITITDDGNMKENLDLIFNGDRAGDRRDWIGL